MIPGRTAADGWATNGGRRPSRIGDGELVRRLDWRFLLPSPRLRRVLYLGPGTDDLWPALRRFSTTAVHAASGRESRGVKPSPEAFDLLVVQGRLGRALGEAEAALSEDALLYWEMSRRRGRIRSPWRETAPGGSRSGWVEPTLHWHHPDFERCRRIVPVDRFGDVAWSLARDRGRMPPAMVRRAGKLLARSGLLARAVPCLSLIARRAGTAASSGRDG